MSLNPVTVAVTMGDPAGIGPEVVIKAVLRADVRQRIRPVLVGPVSVFRDTADELGLHAEFVPLEDEDAPGEWGNGAIAVHDPEPGRELRVARGKVAAEHGRAAWHAIEAAANLTRTGRAEAMCTAPVSKEALHAAGCPYPGHTELLAEYCGAPAVRMMFEGGGLRVLLQTIHEPLARVPELITGPALDETFRLLLEWCAVHLPGRPRIAVCGLNPHAGESGLMGSEESEIIAPAVERAQAQGMDIAGPLPADTVFHRVREGEFEVAVAMYHDQGLIPVKTLDFHGGVNLTVGLPLVRTSPDHGTAFALAGQRQANESSMAAALRCAARLARDRRQFKDTVVP